MASSGLRPLTWEQREWKARIDPSMFSRSAALRAREPYRSAVAADIAGLRPTVSAEVAALSDDARAAISRFDAELSSALLGTEIAPLASVLLRTESASSSQIENITTGARALAVAEVRGAKHGSNALLVRNNVEAMHRALADEPDLDTAAVLAIHETLMHGQSHADPGRLRTEQVWIGGRGMSPHGADFVPPHHDRVPASMEDLMSFVERADVPLVTQAAIAHAQFETIHPFNDGNGRTGRALIHAMLRRGGATTRLTIPVSAGLLADLPAYFGALDAYRLGDPDPIVEQLSTSAFRAVANGRELAQELARLLDDWRTRVTSRRDSASQALLGHLLSHPAVTTGTVSALLEVSQPTADAAIRRLVEAGVLIKTSSGNRNRVWVATGVTDALDEFAARAGRRG